MKIEQITFTRFIAAFAIIIFHFGLKIYPFSHPFISPVFYLAKIGVSYFFILSGFIMVVAYNKKEEINALDYYKNRIARIYPVYLFAIVLFIVHNLIFGKYLNINDILLNLATIQAWIPGKALSLNYPGWSLSVEFFFYALFPLLFNFIYKRFNYIIVLIAVIFIWLGSQFFFNILVNSPFYQGYGSKSHDFLYYFPLLHLNQFLLGNLAGYYFIKNPDKQGNYDLLILGLCVLLVLILRFSFGINYHNGLMAIIFVPIILAISYNQGFLTKLFTNKFLIFLGEISFGMYILQVPSYYWSKQLLNLFQINDDSATFYFSVLILILISILSYLIIETPSRNFLKNLSFPQKKS